MTEVTNCRLCLEPAAHTVRLWPFLAAALLAPLTFAALGVIGLHIGLMLTVISAAMSLPGYICLGLPAAWLAIRYGPDTNGLTPDLGRITTYALIAVAMLVPLGTLFMMIIDGMHVETAFKGALGYAGIGLIVGPIEALLFAYWYRKFTRNAVARTDPQIFT